MHCAVCDARPPAQGIQGHGFYGNCVVPIIENTARECELTDRLRQAIIQYPQANAVLVRRHGALGAALCCAVLLMWHYVIVVLCAHVMHHIITVPRDMAQGQAHALIPHRCVRLGA